MGGIWGLAIATALENVPVETRGFLSGVLQQGYAVGYLFAGAFLSCYMRSLHDVHDITAVVNLTVVPHSRHTWRTQFWVVAGLSSSTALFRAILPESEVFLRAREAKRQTEGKGASAASKTRIFLGEAKTMLKEHWMLCLYAVLMMSGTPLPLQLW